MQTLNVLTLEVYTYFLLLTISHALLRKLDPLGL